MTQLTRLDAISRKRALTMEESSQLEREVKTRRWRHSTMIPGMTANPEPALLGNYESAWRTAAENSNVWFMDALKRYFARGGRG